MPGTRRLYHRTCVRVLWHYYTCCWTNRSKCRAICVLMWKHYKAKSLVENNSPAHWQTAEADREILLWRGRIMFCMYTSCGNYEKPTRLVYKLLGSDKPTALPRYVRHATSAVVYGRLNAAKSPHSTTPTPTSSRGCHEDATRKMVPLNLSW